MPFAPISLFLTSPGLTLAATATTAAKKTSGSSYSLLIILALGLGAYFLFLRPRQQRMRQAQAQQRQADIGDEVVTTGGIVGRVRAFRDDRVTLEIAPGTSIEVVKAAIARRVDPPAYDPPPSDAPRSNDPLPGNDSGNDHGEGPA